MNNLKKQSNFGLRELPPDPNDFQMGRVFFLPELDELPEDFIINRPTIRHQGDSDYCTAFASCAASELQEKVLLSPIYAFAMSKYLSGGIEVWGQDLRAAMKVHTKFGCIEESDAEYKVSKDINVHDLRNPSNWDTTENRDLASKHKKESYFAVTGQYDTFDTIRAAMWKFRTKQQAVVLGLQWRWGLREKFLKAENAGNGTYGHAIVCIGWERIDGVDYLILQNSYGKTAGENGLHYVTREIINEDIPRFGAFMMVDLPRSKAEYMMDNGITDKDYWFIALWKALINLIKKL